MRSMVSHENIFLLALRRLFLLIVVIGASFLISGSSQKILAKDTPPLEEYGKKLLEDSQCTVWWAPSTYKIPRSGGVPSQQSPIKIKAARNEAETFQLVVHPNERMENFRVEVKKLNGPEDYTISTDNIRIYEEVYVHVRKPTDKYAEPGYYPDPLPRLDGPLNLSPSENKPIWVRVDIPDNAVAGNYNGTIKLSSGDWNKNIPFHLKVWDFTLPKKTPLKSAFGLNSGPVTRYQHLKTEQQMKEVMDKYYRAMDEQRLSPYNPFSLYPMKVYINGKYWQGGRIITDNPYQGKHALQLEDQSATENMEAHTLDSIDVQPNRPYILSWHARTKSKGSQYTVLIKGYNAEGKHLPYESVLEVYSGSTKWESDSLKIGNLSPKVDHVKVYLFATYRDYQGSKTGTTWFDDVALYSKESDHNLLGNFGFELNPDKMSVVLDFSEFDKAGRRYLDKMGFNAFRLSLKGLGGGNFYSRHKGYFGGFEQGTEGYNKLFGSYLSQIEDHLEKKGWLDKAYVYWFDEPSKKDYQFVRAGMKNIHRFAPKLTRLITENNPGPAIMNEVETSTTILNHLDKEKVDKWVGEGKNYWSYVCTVPKAPYINEFIDHEAINLRIWPWLSWKYNLNGILLWATTYWNSTAASPHGRLQNPWKDPMSYVSSSNGNPYGSTHEWGNGDGRYFYPPGWRHGPPESKKPNLSGPVLSIRLEYLREGIEDYTYFWMLKQAIKEAYEDQKSLVSEANKLLKVPDEILQDTKNYTKDPELLMAYRKKIARILSQFNKD